jgi:hypothetical protein
LYSCAFQLLGNVNGVLQQVKAREAPLELIAMVIYMGFFKVKPSDPEVARLGLGKIFPESSFGNLMSYGTLVFNFRFGCPGDQCGRRFVSPECLSAYAPSSNEE